MYGHTIKIKGARKASIIWEKKDSPEAVCNTQSVYCHLLRWA